MIDTLAQKILPTKKNYFLWLNAVFLIGLLILGKTNAFTIVIAYFLETIIIGFINALKMFNIVIFNKSKSFGTIFFFLTHYMFFIAIQLVFVFTFYFFNEDSYDLSLKGITLVLISITINNLMDYILNFIIPKAFTYTNVDDLFMQPYPRIIIQQFAVIIAGFFMIYANNGIMAIAILLIIIKTLFELYINANPNILNKKLKK